MILPPKKQKTVHSISEVIYNPIEFVLTNSKKQMFQISVSNSYSNLWLPCLSQDMTHG